MDFSNLIDEYVRAWNAKELDSILRLLDKRATYYDALWMEYVTSRELPQYLESCIEEESCRYERVGDVVQIKSNVAYYQYDAYSYDDGEAGTAVFSGAEVFSFRKDKIVAISDFYCDPDPVTLAEVARLSAQYHGETRHVEAGLPASKAFRFRRRLLQLLDEDHVYLDPELTQVQLATLIDCSGTQLSQLIDDEFGTTFLNCMDQYRVRHAKKLLEDADSHADFASIAQRSGFESLDDFEGTFKRIARESPKEFLNHVTGSFEILRG